MTVRKLPFDPRVYVIRDDTTIDVRCKLNEWLNSTGQGQWRNVGWNLIEITDPKIEAMFILRWCN